MSDYDADSWARLNRGLKSTDRGFDFHTTLDAIEALAAMGTVFTVVRTEGAAGIVYGPGIHTSRPGTFLAYGRDGIFFSITPWDPEIVPGTVSFRDARSDPNFGPLLLVDRLALTAVIALCAHAPGVEFVDDEGLVR